MSRAGIVNGTSWGLALIPGVRCYEHSVLGSKEATSYYTCMHIAIRRSNRLVLLNSKHRLQILQQLRIALMSLTTVALQHGVGNTDHREYQQMTSLSVS